MSAILAVISKLEGWSDHGGDFHSDRQLSDEVLIADGWRVEPDQSFEGGVCWSFGANPRYCCAESGRPHPVNDMNTASGVVPFGYAWMLVVMPDGECSARVAPGRPDGSPDPWRFEGRSGRPAVALLIAALKAKAAALAQFSKPEGDRS